eukprot:TRINITY_DN66881_c3_g10_i2.p1 TRINITY_DN66881_c3_g10~~TRINITY_DN66881_c3_g10_i2.p1  ORF type:complete len:133 (+),score=23.25 TRINITY_DN66881_c3_g10_i2:79-477(+)
MPSTGITPTDECMAAYVGIKTKRTCRFIEMKISNDNTVIEVVRTGDRQLGWSEFLNELPKDACRYYLYDYQWVNDDGITKDKLLFVNWYDLAVANPSSGNRDACLANPSQAPVTMGLWNVFHGLSIALTQGS